MSSCERLFINIRHYLYSTVRVCTSFIWVRLAELPPDAEGKPPPLRRFQGYRPGFVDVDVKYRAWMPDEAEHRYLFAVIDRASRWVYFEIRPDKTADTAAGFLERLHARVPILIRTADR